MIKFGSQALGEPEFLPELGTFEETFSSFRSPVGLSALIGRWSLD